MLKIPAGLKAGFKPAAWGFVTAVVLTTIVGFSSWGFNWYTAGSARELAKQSASKEVVAALAPICAEQFRAGPDAPTRLAAMEKANSWERNSMLEKGGAATMPGAKGPIQGVAEACFNMLKGVPKK